MDRQFLTFFISVKYEDGCSQNIGNLVLSQFDKEKDCHIGTSYGCEMIMQILKLFKVDDFSQIKDKMIWVYGERDGFAFDVKAIESLAVDKDQKMLNFEKVASEFIGETSNE